MNVVLSIESVRPLLTGIGRYTWELATRLPLQQEISSLRFISDGLWCDLPSIYVQPVLNNQSERLLLPAQLNYKGRLRQRLGQIQLVSRLYHDVKAKLAKHQLKGIKQGLFHGPDYFVPQSNLSSVVTIHDLSAYSYPEWHPQTRIERVKKDIPLAIKRANLILTDSEATKLEVMKEFNLSQDQVCAISLGVDDSFHPRSEAELKPILAQFGLKVNAYSFFVSTIEPRKNLINLIAAYSKLPIDMRQRWPLVLVGSPGWQSDDIHQAIIKAQKESWLIYLGFVAQSYLPLLYAGCRLFTYPSLYEGFGLPIAEAMASGVPVLTSNCSSMPEVANGAAMLVEPVDVDGIYMGLRMALEDEVWRSQAREKGLKRAAELTWDACVRGTIAAYQRVYHAEQQLKL